MENQEFIYKLGMFEQQIKQLQQQLQAVEQTITDLDSLNFGLDDLKGKIGKEILAPFGRGIFVKAKLLSEKLTVDVGGKNFVIKDIPQTKEIIQEQIKKLEDAKKELNDNLERIGNGAQKMIEKQEKQENK